MTDPYVTLGAMMTIVTALITAITVYKIDQENI